MNTKEIDNPFKTDDYLWAVAEIIPGSGIYYVCNPSYVRGRHALPDFSTEGRFQRPQKIIGTPHFLVAPADTSADPKQVYYTLAELVLVLGRSGKNLAQIHAELRDCREVRVGGLVSAEGIEIKVGPLAVL